MKVNIASQARQNCRRRGRSTVGEARLSGVGAEIVRLPGFGMLARLPGFGAELVRLSGFGAELVRLSGFGTELARL